MGVRRILLIFLFVVLPSIGHCSVYVASMEYVNNIVKSIPKVNLITEQSSENELATASGVWNMGAMIREELIAHQENKDNPHNVTAEQVGLGNLKNIDTTDAANITEGVIDYRRLPIGMVADTVAAGNDARFFGVPRTKPNQDAPDGMVWMWFE